MRLCFFFVFFGLLLLLHAVTAEAVTSMDRYFEEGCGHWGAPKSLAMAIAQTESDMSPWAVNIRGKSHYPKTKDEAMRLVQQAIRKKQSFDIGVMQINSYWLRRFNLDAKDIIDPQLNIILGCWILSQEINRFGLNWRAIGSYHTPIVKDPARARAYANRVMRVWRQLQ